MTIGRHFVCSVNSSAGKKTLLLEHRNGSEALLLQNGVTASLSLVEAELIKKSYEKAIEAYACLGVLTFHVDEEECLMYMFFVTGCTSVGKIGTTDVFRISNCSYVGLQEPHALDSRISDVQKLLMSGCFYFPLNLPGDEYPFDLLLSSQKQQDQKEPDSRFFWNHIMHDYLGRFGIDCDKWFVKLICGGVEIRTIYVGARQAKACLISRLSCERAGTRFNVRGTNDDGHVANFVETEQVVAVDDTITSFIQTRGSVPLFWEQPGVQVGSHKVKLSRGYEASTAAFDRHMSTLKHLYGYQLLINLLGGKEGEATLSSSYRDHLKDSQHSFDTHMIAFDYHRHCGGGKNDNIKLLLDKARPSIVNFQFFSMVNGGVVKTQIGTIRSNCLDCLDRTNVTQTEIGLQLLTQQLESIGLNDPQLLSRFTEAFKSLWQLNGDHISRMYSGTGAMEVGTRNTFASKLHDGAVTVKRTIKNNFFDGSKQEAIDILLLGNIFAGPAGDRARALLRRTFLHSSPSIMRDICLQHKNFTTTEEFRISVGTWNVNGGRHFRSIAYKHQSLHDWLLDCHKTAPAGILDHEETFEKPTDLFAIGFEELVDLNTSNIISTSSNQKREWGLKLQQMLSRDHEYIMITAEQLVGVCLFVFIRTKHAPYVRDVAIQIIKTGLKGNAGNKGAVAIRLLLHSTSICFVCGHYAAGQSNVTERNHNYHDISRRIAFPMGSELKSHDYVFWCGDFNYRIDLPNAQVKELVKNEQWTDLLASDQLLLQKAEGKVFKGFHEGPINFAPTYKYDLFSDDYDTSEKMRTPAWTDRVLWRRNEGTGIEEIEDEEDFEECPPEWKADYQANNDVEFNPGRIVYYGRAELKTSDHRPVMAVIDIEVEKVLPGKLTSIHQDVMTSYGPADPTVIVSVPSDEVDVELDMQELMEELENYGNVVLIRLVDEDLHVTYESGTSAMEALELDGRNIGGVQVQVVLRSSQLLEETDHSILNMITSSDMNEGNTDYDEENDDDWFSRKGSCLLTRSASLSAAVLEPEKLSKQQDYLEDFEEEEEEEEEKAFAEAQEFTDEQLEKIRKESFSLASDSDDEFNEEAPQSTPRKSPQPQQQPKKQPPKRPSVPRPNAPGRPSVPPVRRENEAVKKPGLSEEDISELIEERSSTLEASEEKPKTRPPPPRPGPARPPPNKAAPSRPNAPSRPKPPLPAAKTTSSETTTNTEQSSTAAEENVSDPYNIQHLMHVDATNVEEFIAKMKQQYAQNTPTETPDANTAQPPKQRHNSLAQKMGKMRASIKVGGGGGGKSQQKTAPLISGPSDLRKTDGATAAIPGTLPPSTETPAPGGSVDTGSSKPPPPVARPSKPSPVTRPTNPAPRPKPPQRPSPYVDMGATPAPTLSAEPQPLQRSSSDVDVSIESVSVPSGRPQPPTRPQNTSEKVRPLPPQRPSSSSVEPATKEKPILHRRDIEKPEPPKPPKPYRGEYTLEVGVETSLNNVKESTDTELQTGVKIPPPLPSRREENVGVNADRTLPPVPPSRTTEPPRTVSPTRAPPTRPKTSPAIDTGTGDSSLPSNTETIEGEPPVTPSSPPPTRPPAGYEPPPAPSRAPPVPSNNAPPPLPPRTDRVEPPPLPPR